MPSASSDTARKPVNRIVALMAVIGACLAPWLAAATDDSESPIDSRQVYYPGAPGWLSAIGKLQVPGRKIEAGRDSQYREDCSASLIAGSGGGAADTIVTAWHCLEFYSDLSKQIVFTLLPDSKHAISSEVYRIADGGGMYADWAILRLHKPIVAPGVSPLKVNPGRPRAGASIVMAGYSSDAGLGDFGRLLTYDAHCEITRQERVSSNSNCRAYRGASGGAVVQLSKTGEALFSGVISQGDGAGTSIFVPVDGFRGAINRHLGSTQ
jgi:Trypsin-like peptidase domain